MELRRKSYEILLITIIILLFSNKCLGDKSVFETWDGITTEYTDTEGLPYERDNGRKSCLLKFDYPRSFDLFKPNTWYQTNVCAEESPVSSYLDPKIRVRMQTCNIIWCWTKSADIKFDGDCVFWATGYGITTIRLCARLGLEQRETDRTTGEETVWYDHGYTPGEHLNYEGATKPDPLSETEDTDENGDPVKVNMNLSKVCAYDDPGLYQIITGDIDIFDINPVKQPFHVWEGPVHPIIEMIIIYLEVGAGVYDIMLGIVKSLNEKTLDLGFIEGIVDAIMAIIDLIMDLVISILESIGQLNKKADPLGCTNIPLGPFPPAFCETPIVYGQPKAYAICSVDKTGTVQKPTYNNRCVYSETINNIVHNAVMVTFEHKLKFCSEKDGEDINNTDCVTISSYGLTPKVAFEEYNGMLSDCSASSPTTPCVTVNSKYSKDQKYRAIYGLKSGDLFISYSLYYKESTPDCPDTSKGLCQEIWGFDVGEYSDLVIDFSGYESYYNTNYKTSSVITLSDPIGNTKDLKAVIVRKNDDETYPEASTEQICVYEVTQEGDKLEDCKTRASFYKTHLYECDGTVCEYKNDALQAQIELIDPTGSHSTYGVVEAASVDNPNPPLVKINLAGKDYQVFITDNAYQQMPFNMNPDNIASASTLAGKYSSDPTINEEDEIEVPDGAYYMGGLEYEKGLYARGGMNLCVSDINMEQCPTKDQLCVCAKKNIYSTESSTGTSTEYYLISNRLEDRTDPPSSYGLILDDSLYCDPKLSDYDTETLTKTSYESDTEGYRTKTAGELGLCMEIPFASCEEINEPTRENKYAIWPETPIGDIAFGECIEGYHQEGIPQRYCYFNEDEVPTFQEITDGECIADSAIPIEDDSTSATITQCINTDFLKSYDSTTGYGIINEVPLYYNNNSLSGIVYKGELNLDARSNPSLALKVVTNNSFEEGSIYSVTIDVAFSNSYKTYEISAEEFTDITDVIASEIESGSEYSTLVLLIEIRSITNSNGKEYDLSYSPFFDDINLKLEFEFYCK